MIGRVQMDKLSDTFKEKSRANVPILAHLCAAESGGECCPPLSSTHLHSSVTELWAQKRRRRWWTVAGLKIVEKRHKVSFNVGNITHLISHIIFSFFITPVSRNGSPTPLWAWIAGVRWVSCEFERPSTLASFIQPFWGSFAVFVQLKHTSCVMFFSF